MAKRIIWSLKAKHDLRDILKYWDHRNKSKNYSSKLLHIIRDSIKLLADYPKAARETEIEKVRVRVIKDYQIFYKERNDAIRILRVWDSRQDYNKLDLEE